ncbi:MAG: hypothetical protein ONB46_16870 [candidate division KSB1 bacterium]|nr:hypothetical protein [candidate division KSB1 bacterium]MDZ7367335.1 hypothetical protein [candidate division KSB1 bacterium]MDZ7405216.1 hypothetical protein [candidate division KSB1 bacterium]
MSSPCHLIEIDAVSNGVLVSITSSLFESTGFCGGAGMIVSPVAIRLLRSTEILKRSPTCTARSLPAS